jgi:hypothetical protein
VGSDLIGLHVGMHCMAPEHGLGIKTWSGLRETLFRSDLVAERFECVSGDEILPA